MNNLLVGNGINIQYDNQSYTTQAIVLRILEELDSPNFPKHIIVDEPILLKNYLGKLFLYARAAIDGYFNNSTICSAEKIALFEFIERYKYKKNSLRITDIGFEDYYLIHDLVCHKHGITNPEQFIVRESMKMAYFYSIYNHGELNLLNRKYSYKFKNFLKGFDNIFSTNYDSNIELAIDKNIYHIHGYFEQLSEVYNPNSFRNRLDDAPIKKLSIDSSFNYLYSTAVSTYCGDYKQYLINQNILANKAIEKMADAYLKDTTIQQTVNNWEKDSNYLIVNLSNAIKLKVDHPDLNFKENYPISELSAIEGNLTILGLSPYNDYHLFNIIDSARLDECIYYFFSEDERSKVEQIFPKLNKIGKLKFKNVQDFWRNM